MSAWTQFWDMHSGGGCKEPPYDKIYIEAPESEATTIFYNRFGHNPERVTCTCCGEDYSITEYESLEDATACHRDCAYIEDERGWHATEERLEGRYIELGDEIPEGYKKSSLSSYRTNYLTLSAYIKKPFSIDEFRTLNRCLDNAIADAVLEFSTQRDQSEGFVHVGVLNALRRH